MSSRGWALPRSIDAIPAQDLAVDFESLPMALRPHGLNVTVGWERELFSIERFLQLESRGRCRIAALIGEPGVGKTTILASVAATFAGAGGVVFYGDGDPDVSTPFPPFIEMLADVDLDRVGLHPLGRAALVRHLAPVASSDPSSDGFDPTTDRQHLLDAAQLAVRTPSTVGRCVG